MITGSITYDQIKGSITVYAYTLPDLGEVPDNALLTEDGYPILTEDGNYILTET